MAESNVTNIVTLPCNNEHLVCDSHFLLAKQLDDFETGSTVSACCVVCSTVEHACMTYNPLLLLLFCCTSNC
jgi:hypothetical protein